jgi:flagellar M-ring protein FliF
MNDLPASESAQSLAAPGVLSDDYNAAAPAASMEQKGSLGRRALQILAVAGSLAVVGALLLRNDERSLLCGRLLKADAERVCRALAAMNIRYTVADNGSAIYVSKHQVHSARLALVRRSVAEGGLPALDIIDCKTSPSKSTVYNAALEEELATTIASMDGVEAARVMIENPGNRGQLEGKLPFAVIVVHASGAKKLSAEQIQVIQRLVVSSTGLLAADQVVVLQSPDDRALAQFKS